MPAPKCVSRVGAEVWRAVKSEKAIVSNRQRGLGVVRISGLVGLVVLIGIALSEIAVQSDDALAVVQFSRGTVPAGDILASLGPAEAAKNGRVRLRVIGHTGPQGDRIANMHLAAARAELVAQTLIDAGVPVDSLVWESAGGEDPIACEPNASPRACSLAQARAELSVLRTIDRTTAYLGLAFGVIGTAIVGAMALSHKRRRRIPWYGKALGVGLCAGGLAAAMLSVGGQGTEVALMMAIAYLCAHGAAISPLSPDPWKGRNVSESLKARIESARSVVERIKTANHRIHSPELSAALDSLYAKGQRIIGLLEAQPVLVRRSDRFLTVYLDGAARVSEKYADIHRQTDSVELDQSYREFLDRTIRTFDQQHEALIADDVLDLDVEIEVLQKRMVSEGIK